MMVANDDVQSGYAHDDDSYNHGHVEDADYHGDLNHQQHQHSSNISTAHLPQQQQRSAVAPGVEVSHQLQHGKSNRMAFIRRSKRGDINSSAHSNNSINNSNVARRVASRDNDSNTGDEAPKTRLSDEHQTIDVSVTNPPPAVAVPSDASPALAPLVPDGSLKKRIIRIEKTILEQTAWVKNKFLLDDTETLLDSCSAALVKKIMLQGRLHITSSTLCFYAKIFGSVTKERWDFSTIQSVRKRRGGFVANSIKITFLNPETPPVVIASLNRRDQILAIIASRLSVLSPSFVEDSRPGSIEGDSEDYSDGGLGFHNERSSRVDHRPKSDRSGYSTNTSDAPPGERISAAEQLAPRRSSETSGEIVDDESPSMDNLVWCGKGDVLDDVKGKEYARRTERVRGILSAPVILAFNALFVEDWMITSCLPACNNFDVESSEWYSDEEYNGCMRRDVSFRRPLRYRIGPKETRCEETHRYTFTTGGGVLFESENLSLDAPFGDYFRVESYLELKPTRNPAESEFIASLAIHFSKSTMLRSKIEAGALAEITTTFEKILSMGQEYLAETVTKEQIAAVLKRTQGKQKAPKAAASKVPRPRTSSVSKKQRKSSTSVEKEQRTPSAKSSPGSKQNSGESRRRHRPSGQHRPPPALSTATPPVVENNSNSISADVFSTKILRITAVGSLLLVSVLLVFVLVSFQRMRHEFTVLQAIVQQLQVASVKRAANTCSGS